VSDEFEKHSATAHVWYWIQLAIWPLIRDTDCIYCIFIRGMLAGGVITVGGWVAWTMLSQHLQ
jgi:hypothetical protein